MILAIDHLVAYVRLRRQKSGRTTLQPVSAAIQPLRFMVSGYGRGGQVATFERVAFHAIYPEWRTLER